MLKRIVLIFGVLLLIVAGWLYLHQDMTGCYFAFGFYGLIIVGSILFERYHYRPEVNRLQPGWRKTGERFIDPGTGRLMEVRYNEKTGERDYVEAGGQP